MLMVNDASRASVRETCFFACVFRKKLPVYLEKKLPVYYEAAG